MRTTLYTVRAGELYEVTWNFPVSGNMRSLTSHCAILSLRICSLISELTLTNTFVRSLSELVKLSRIGETVLLQRKRLHRLKTAVDKRFRIKGSTYTISKAGIIVLTETIAEELRKYEVNVNCIIPRAIDTRDSRRNLS
jgi:NAD(P)-dependent dehydrogenase (short-subunit alcohol dehydrogenase family)